LTNSNQPVIIILQFIQYKLPFEIRTSERNMSEKRAVLSEKIVYQTNFVNTSNNSSENQSETADCFDIS